MPTEGHFESFAEMQIRQAIERGEFDDLPGAGQPLADLGPVHDPDWWARRLVARERLRERADDLRRIIRTEVPRLAVMKDRAAAQVWRAELDRMIAEVNEELAPADRIPPPVW